MAEKSSLGIPNHRLMSPNEVRTWHEMKRGKSQVLLNALQEETDKLQKRLNLKQKDISVQLVEYPYDNKYCISVSVLCADGATMSFEDDVMNFPSDELITRIALVI